MKGVSPLTGFLSGLSPGARRLVQYWMTLDAPKEDNGWRTSENGKHYRINSKGDVTAGPNAMMGKNVREHRRGSKPRVPKDVTSEYKYSATPGKGAFNVDPAIDKDKAKDEIEIARWLHGTFGGSMRVRHKTDSSSPDYEWRGMLWELKTPESVKRIDDRTRHGIGQIGSHADELDPGGLVLNLNKCDVSIDDAVQIVQKRANNSASFGFDVVIIHKSGEYRVIRIEKRSD